MIYQVKHCITYEYERAVEIEPLTVRLRPRSDGTQHLMQWTSSVHPTPVTSTPLLDLFGNSVLQLSFLGTHDSLTVDVESCVETLRMNPFDFLVADPQIVNLPVSYDFRTSAALSAYTHYRSDNTVEMWVADMVAAVHGQTQPFLLYLTKKMQRDFTPEIRYYGPPFVPSYTLAEGRGSCRDLAMLFICACRCQGLAARFVSGYTYESNRTIPAELHAWVEVYLPGGGWRGYDPTLGVAVADGHIPVAVGPDAEWTAPTEGQYRSAGVISRMHYLVEISCSDG